MQLPALVVSVFAGFFGDPKEAEPLQEAARTGNVVQAHIALTLCPDAVHAPRRWGKGDYPSPVHTAAYRNHVGVLQLLIAWGGDVNDPGRSHYSPLQHATMSNSRATAELLLKHGARLDIFSAVGLDKWDEVQRCFAAARALGLQARLANAGLPLYWGKWRLLNWAIDGGSARMVELLIRNGANVNPCGTPSPWPEKPPLHEAIRRGHLDIAEVLLRNGAKIDAQDYDGYTALHCAVLYRDVAAARFLLERGATVDTQLNHHAPRISDVNGDARTFFTPLHTAAEAGAPQLVALLLAHGASLGARDNRNRTPLDVAATVPDEWDRDAFGHKPGKLTPARALCVAILIRTGTARR